MASSLLDSAKEQHLHYNTLACLAKSLVGTNTCIDLRNESIVSGKIDHVDGFMNISMSDVLLRDSRDKELTFEYLFIQSRNVRNIHIPKYVNVINNIETALQPRQRHKPDVGRTFKQKRAMNMQREMMERIHSIKNQNMKDRNQPSTSFQR